MENSGVIRQGMILAAGEGTRLRPLTLTRPKPMLPVGEHPVLEWIVLWLLAHGIEEIAINLHYRPETITEHFADGAPWGVRLRYSPEETIMGSAGGLKLLESYFTGPFVVVYGDVLTDLDLHRLIRFHQKATAEAHATLSLYRASNPTECGIVGIESDGRVTRFVEKPAPDAVFSDLTNSGVLILDTPLLSAIPANRFYDIGSDLLPDLLARQIPIFAQEIEPEAYLIDMGTPEKYARVQQEWPTARMQSLLR